MKRLIWLLIVGLAATALVGGWGCSDSSDDNPISPGDTNDPSFGVFVEEFEDVEMLTSYMLRTTLEFIDSITSEAAAGKRAFAPGGRQSSAALGLDYHAASGFWYCTSVDTMDSGEIFSFVDSLQFKYGDLAVQWPDEDSITEVVSYHRLTVTGHEIDTGWATQNATITAHPIDEDLLVFNGNGEMHASASDSEDSSEIAFDFNYSVTDMVADPEVLFWSVDGCPISGAIAYTGTVDISFPEASATGAWGVSEVFSNGTVGVTITHNTRQWTMTDSCNCGDGIDSLSDGDSVTVMAFLDGYALVEEISVLGYYWGRNFVDSVLEHPSFGSKIMPLSQVSLSPAADTFAMEYHPSSGYWRFYVAEEDSAGTAILIDSIQFRHGDLPVQWPDSALLTQVTTGLSYQANAPGTLVGTATQQSTMTGNFIGGGNLTINGTQSVGLTLVDGGESSTCTWDFEVDGVMSSFVLQTSPSGYTTGCPLSGTLTVSGQISLGCTGDLAVSVDDSWQIVETFYGDSITYDIQNSANEWDYVEECATRAPIILPMGLGDAFPRFPQ